MSGKETDQFERDALGELVRHAGRGPQLSSAARERIYAATRRQWEATVEARRRSNPAHDRHNRRWLMAASLAAGLAAVAFVGVRVMESTNQAAALFASVTAVEGIAGIDRGGSAMRIGADSATLVHIGDRLMTDASGKLALRLSSGQELRVNANSEITIADAGAIELESGTVYFDSASTVPGAPFTIHTRVGSVQHIGTQYQADLGGGQLRVKVREGAAAIANDAGEFVAQAGEELQIGAAGELGRGAIAPDDPSWRWAEDLAVVQSQAQQTLLEALAWVGRETGLRVSFSDAATQTRAASVVLYELAGLDPREVLDVIRSTTQFRLEQANGELVVSAR